MKLKRSELRKLIIEVATGESSQSGNEDMGSVSKDEQNKVLGDLMYEYLEKFCQAPEDKAKLKSAKFGHRKNTKTASNSDSKKILNMKNSKVDYVYCFLHPKQIERIFNLTSPQAKNHGGAIRGIPKAVKVRGQNILKHLNDMIDYAKRKSGFNSKSLKISIGTTTNSTKYHSSEDDSTVYYIYRETDK